MEEQGEHFRTRRGHWDMSDRRTRGYRRGGRRGNRGEYRGKTVGSGRPARDEFGELRDEYRGVMLEYRTQECPRDCKEEYCDMCHSSQAQAIRRKPERLSSGVWSYLPTPCLQQCTDPHCAFSHSQEETLYHPLQYKTRPCAFPLDRNDCCTKYGYHCPFFHTELDKEPLPGFPYNILKSTLMMPKLDTIRLQIDYNTRQNSEKAGKIDPEIALKPLPKPEIRSTGFSRETYKVYPCENPSCDEGNCLNYHCIDEKRRGNDSIYSFTQCPDTYIESARAFRDPGKCPRGEECQYSHTNNEVFYHKDYYQTAPCSKPTCRDRFCPFTHVNLPVKASLPDPSPSSSVLPAAPVSVSKSETDLQVSLLDRMCKVNSDIGGLKIQIEEATDQLKRMEEQLACVHCGKPQQQYAFFCGHAFCATCVEGNIKQRTYICRKCNKPSADIIEMKYLE